MTAASLHAVIKHDGAVRPVPRRTSVLCGRYSGSGSVIHWHQSLLMRDGLHTDVHYQRHQHFSPRNSGSACMVLSTERIHTLITHAAAVASLLYVILCVLYAVCLTPSYNVQARLSFVVNGSTMLTR